MIIAITWLKVHQSCACVHKQFKCIHELWLQITEKHLQGQTHVQTHCGKQSVQACPHKTTQHWVQHCTYCEGAFLKVACECSPAELHCKIIRYVGLNCDLLNSCKQITDQDKDNNGHNSVYRTEQHSLVSNTTTTIRS